MTCEAELHGSVTRMVSSILSHIGSPYTAHTAQALTAWRRGSGAIFLQFLLRVGYAVGLNEHSRFSISLGPTAQFVTVSRAAGAPSLTPERDRGLSLFRSNASLRTRPVDLDPRASAGGTPWPVPAGHGGADRCKDCGCYAATTGAARRPEPCPSQ